MCFPGNWLRQMFRSHPKDLTVQASYRWKFQSAFETMQRLTGLGISPHSVSLPRPSSNDTEGGRVFCLRPNKCIKCSMQCRQKGLWSISSANMRSGCLHSRNRQMNWRGRNCTRRENLLYCSCSDRFCLAEQTDPGKRLAHIHSSRMGYICAKEEGSHTDFLVKDFSCVRAGSSIMVSISGTT